MPPNNIGLAVNHCKIKGGYLDLYNQLKTPNEDKNSKIVFKCICNGGRNKQTYLLNSYTNFCL